MALRVPAPGVERFGAARPARTGLLGDVVPLMVADPQPPAHPEGLQRAGAHERERTEDSCTLAQEPAEGLLKFQPDDYVAIHQTREIRKLLHGLRHGEPLARVGDPRHLHVMRGAERQEHIPRRTKSAQGL
jgi:hypothetical protein